MIEWKKYEPFNSEVEQPLVDVTYLVYCGYAEVASFSQWKDWKIGNNEVYGVTHYAEINLPLKE